MISQICVDMDGVLCDIVKAMLDVVAPGYIEQVYERWPAGEYSMEKILGLSTAELWKPIEAKGADFWANIPAFSWHARLLVHCRSIAPTVVLTKPTDCPMSLAGKLRWLHTHFGANFRDYLMGPNKHFCARRDSVLIDDCDENCERFTASGGRAIVFPQRWNRNHHLISDPYGYTTTKLEQYANA